MVRKFQHPFVIGYTAVDPYDKMLARHDLLEVRVERTIDVPLLANATEFGKGAPWTVPALNDLGVDMVIFPVSLLRLAMGAAQRGLRVLAQRGELSSLFDAMQSRSDLYELLDYESYELFDGDVFNFRSTD